MKHLFYVHSHITFLVSKQYILDKGINPDDCLFFCVRNYQMPVAFENMFVNVLSYPKNVLKNGHVRLLHKNNPIIGHKNINMLENTIRAFCVKTSFLFYLPNTFASDFSSAVVTMKECEGFYIIEEGSASYMPANSLPKLFSGWRRVVYYGLRVFLKRFYILRGDFYSSGHYKYQGTIATSKKAFFDMKGKRIIVNNPFIEEHLSNAPDAILSIDASLIMYFTRESVVSFFQDLYKVFQSRKYSTIAYKFHPNYYGDINNLNFFREVLHDIFGNSAYELPQKSVIENVLNTYRIDFYSDFSSIAIYSSLWGGKCYSYAKLLAPYSTVYAQIISNNRIIKEYYTEIEI